MSRIETDWIENNIKLQLQCPSFEAFDESLIKSLVHKTNIDSSIHVTVKLKNKDPMFLTTVRPEVRLRTRYRS